MKPSERNESPTGNLDNERLNSLHQWVRWRTTVNNTAASNLVHSKDGVWDFRLPKGISKRTIDNIDHQRAVSSDRGNTGLAEQPYYMFGIPRVSVHSPVNSGRSQDLTERDQLSQTTTPDTHQSGGLVTSVEVTEEDKRDMNMKPKKAGILKNGHKKDYRYMHEGNGPMNGYGSTGYESPSVSSARDYYRKSITPDQGSGTQWSGSPNTTRVQYYQPNYERQVYTTSRCVLVNEYSQPSYGTRNGYKPRTGDGVVYLADYDESAGHTMTNGHVSSHAARFPYQNGTEYLEFAPDIEPQSNGIPQRYAVPDEIEIQKLAIPNGYGSTNVYKQDAKRDYGLPHSERIPNDYGLQNGDFATIQLKKQTNDLQESEVEENEQTLLMGSESGDNAYSTEIGIDSQATENLGSRASRRDAGTQTLERSRDTRTKSRTLIRNMSPEQGRCLLPKIKDKGRAKSAERNRIIHKNETIIVNRRGRSMSPKRFQTSERERHQMQKYNTYNQQANGKPGNDVEFPKNGTVGNGTSSHVVEPFYEPTPDYGRKKKKGNIFNALKPSRRKKKE